MNLEPLVEILATTTDKERYVERVHAVMNRVPGFLKFALGTKLMSPHALQKRDNLVHILELIKDIEPGFELYIVYDHLYAHIHARELLDILVPNTHVSYPYGPLHDSFLDYASDKSNVHAAHARAIMDNMDVAYFRDSE